MFSSELSDGRGVLTVRFGPLRFRFALPSTTSGLTMELKGWSFLSIPLPLALALRIRAREWQEQDRFRFDVQVALPIAGDLIHYSGWLRPVT